MSSSPRNPSPSVVRRPGSECLRGVLLALFALLLVGTPALGQDEQIEKLTRELELLRGDVVAGPTTATAPAVRMAAYDSHVQMVAASPYRDVPWQFVGPTNVSGRVTDVAVATPRGKTYTIYVASASGGVWKTDNEGISWEPIFEQAASTSIGDIALDPSNQERIWVGTGEANIFRSSMAGCGIYLSENGGRTWTHKGLTGTHTIARVVVHPTNSKVVYVAASGHEWTNNEERGVYRTTDGGDTWEKVLFVDEKTGAIDLVIDPSDPSTLYAATWQRIRKRWNDPRSEVGYSGSGIHRSTDGGDSWQPIHEGLPEAGYRGRIGIDLCASQPSTIYAYVDSYEPVEEQASGTDSYGRARRVVLNGAEIYRSDDRGEHWRRTSKSDRSMRNMGSTYGWVFGQMRVDPSDPDTIYTMGLGLNVSNDSGETFRGLRGMHGDHHALWIDPDNPQYLVNGNDGGVCISYDGGQRWRTFYDNLPVVQFYNVAVDMAEPFHVYGSIQDHGSRRGVVDLSRGRDRVRPVEFEGAPGGEASSHAIDPTDPDLVYSEGFYGAITRTRLSTNERSRIAPTAPEGEAPLRGQWMAPFVLSPHNPRIVYHGMNYLYRSLDRGEGFQRISPDLTGNDPGQLGDIPYQTLFSIAESPLEFGLIYTGSDDGYVYRTPDGGRSWQDISEGLAPGRWISRIEASRFDRDTLYLAQNGKRHDDFTAYLWKSTDRGDTWQDIRGNLPGGPINVVREDPTNGDILYVGTDLGVYVTRDGAATWDALVAGLPSTYVHDLVVHPRDHMLVAATHGRGIYVLDARKIQQFGMEPVAGAEEAAEEAGARDPDTGERAREGRRAGGPPMDATPLLGTWNAKIITEEIDDDDREFQIVILKKEDGSFGGQMRSVRGDSDITSVSLREGGRVRLTVRSEMGNVMLLATLEAGQLKGRMVLRDGDFEMEFEAKKDG